MALRHPNQRKTKNLPAPRESSEIYARYDKEVFGVVDRFHPPIYNERVVPALIKYIDVPITTTKVELKYAKNGEIHENETEVPALMPTMEGFCLKLGISPGTYMKWRELYPALGEADRLLKAKQSEYLVHNGLRKMTDSNFTKFIATNLTGYRDKQDIDITSGGNPINSIFPMIMGKGDFKEAPTVVEGEIIEDSLS